MMSILWYFSWPVRFALKKYHTEVSKKWHSTTKFIAHVKANDSMREFTIYIILWVQIEV